MLCTQARSYNRLFSNSLIGFQAYYLTHLHLNCLVCGMRRNKITYFIGFEGKGISYTIKCQGNIIIISPNIKYQIYIPQNIPMRTTRKHPRQWQLPILMLGIMLNSNPAAHTCLVHLQLDHWSSHPPVPRSSDHSVPMLQMRIQDLGF